MRVTCERCAHASEIEPPPWVVAAGKPFSIVCVACGHRQLVQPTAGISLLDEVGVLGHLDTAAQIDAPVSGESPVAVGDDDEVARRGAETAGRMGIPEGLILPDDVAEVPEPRAAANPSRANEDFEAAGFYDYDPASSPSDDVSEELVLSSLRAESAGAPVDEDDEVDPPSTVASLFAAPPDPTGAGEVDDEVDPPSTIASLFAAPPGRPGAGEVDDEVDPPSTIAPLFTAGSAPATAASEDVDPPSSVTPLYPIDLPYDEQSAEVGLPGMTEGSSGEFMLRQDGALFDVPDLATLQRWIMEHRIDPEDQLSQRGGPWTRCGNRPDLAVFFAAVERLDALSEEAPGFISTAGSLRAVPLVRQPDAEPVTSSGADTEEISDEPSVEDYTQESERQATEEAPGLFAAGEFVRPSPKEAAENERSTFRSSVSGVVPPPLARELFEDPDWDTFTSPSVEQAVEPMAERAAPAAAMGSEFLDEAPARRAGGGMLGWLVGLIVVLFGVLYMVTQTDLLRGESAPAPTPQVRTDLVPPPSAGAAVEAPAPTEAAATPAPATTPSTPRSQPTSRGDVRATAPAAIRTPKPTSSPAPAATPTSAPAAASPWVVDTPTPTPAPPNVDQLIAQGWAAIDAGNGQRAREMFERALEYRPTDGEANYGMGVAFKELGRNADAKRYLCAARKRVNTFDARDIDGILEAMGASCE